MMVTSPFSCRDRYIPLKRNVDFHYLHEIEIDIGWCRFYFEIDSDMLLDLSQNQYSISTTEQQKHTYRMKHRVDPGYS